MELNADQTKLEVAITGELSTVEVETLISDLMERRSKMLPAVPLSLEEFRDHGDGKAPHVSVQDDPYLAAKPLRNGGIRIWLRNMGIGWLAFNLPIDKAAILRDFLISNTPDVDQGPNLFGEDFGDGGASH